MIRPAERELAHEADEVVPTRLYARVRRFTGDGAVRNTLRRREAAGAEPGAAWPWSHGFLFKSE